MALFDRVLILGGGGMLAYAFKQVLPTLAPGVVVRAPNRAELDVCDAVCLADQFERVRPTLVLNCAAHTKVDLCDFQVDLAEAINGRAAGQAAALAKRHAAAFVHYSTDFVFSGQSDRPWRESDAVGPVSAYGRTKLSGERQVAAAHDKALICRTSWLYGPGGPCFPATMVRAARAGKPLTVVADQHGSPTFTYDLVRWTVALLGAGAAGTFHLSNSGETTWFGFTAEILRVFGLDVPLGPLTSAEWQQRVPWSAARPARSTMDCAKAASHIGSPLRPWAEGLIEYYKLSPV